MNVLSAAPVQGFHAASRPGAAGAATHPGRVRSAPMQLVGFSPPLSVGIPTERLMANADPAGAGRQHRSNWCWAACIQMVLNYHGLPVPQEALVARMFGGALPDLPQPGLGICQALSGFTQDRHGQTCRVDADPRSLNDRSVLDELHRGNPLIVGLDNPNGQGGHAYVLSAANFRLDSLGNPHVTSVILRDPWPDNPSRIELPVGEFNARCNFATRVIVERL